MHSDTRNHTEDRSLGVDGPSVEMTAALDVPVVDTNAYNLTEEEEAALLAEYGAAGAFDDLISIPAPSHFRSELNGGANVFLTGDIAVDTGNGGTSPQLLSRTATAEELLHDPLDALLLKYTSTFVSATPSTLMTDAGTTADVSRNRQRRRHSLIEGLTREEQSTPHSCDYLDVWKQSRNAEQALFRKVCDWTLEGKHDAADVEGNTEDADSRLLRQADDLLSKAKTCLASATAPSTEERKRIAEEVTAECNREEHYELDGVIQKEMSEGDADARELLEAAALLRQRCTALVNEGLAEEKHPILTDTIEEAPPQPQETPGVLEEQTVEEVAPIHHSEKAPVSVQENESDTLFAFEIELSKEEKAALGEWDAILEHAKPVAQDRLPKAPSPAPATESTIDWDAIEGTHTATLKAIEAHYKSRIANAKVEVEERRRRRGQEGFLILEAFQHRVDTLVPHTLVVTPSPGMTLPLAASEEAMHAVTTVAGAEKSSSPQLVPLTDIRRRAERQLWLLDREASEAQRMREEDRRIERLVRQQEQRLAEIMGALESCVADEEASRRACLDSADAALHELLLREKRHCDLTRRALLIRETKAAAALAERVAEEFEGSVRELQREEATERRVIQVAMQAEHLQAEQQEAKRMETERLARIEEEERRREAFEQTRQTTDVSVTGCTASQPRGRDSVTFPVDMKRQAQVESDAVVAWLEANREAFDALLESVRTEMDTSLAERKGVKFAPSVERPAKVPQPSSASRAEEAITLNADTLPRLLPLQFSAIAQRPALISQCFHTVSLALDNIAHVDWPSLQSLGIGPHVRRLDLSGNALSSDDVSLVDLLHVFPSLEDVDMSDNGLRTLSLLNKSAADATGLDASRPMSASSRLRGVTAAHRSAQSERCRVTEANFSSNQLRDLASISEMFSHSLQTLHVFANQLTTLEALRTCTRLVRLVANRNRISSLDGLGSLSLLQHLNVCDNTITELTGALVRRHPLLTTLFVSNNPALELRFGGNECFLFLEQLFMNGCGLETLPFHSFPWMPALSVLHLEGNQLTSIEGLAKCRRLTHLNLAFNRLTGDAWGEPLFACRGLQHLDLRGNPCASTERWSTAVIHWFPCLRELNNENISSTAERTWDFPATGDGNVESQRSLNPVIAYLNVARVVHSLYSAKRIRSAEASEEILTEQTREQVLLGNLPSTHGVARPMAGRFTGKQLSIMMKHRAHVRRCQDVLDTLATLLSLVPQSPSGPCVQIGLLVNRHHTNPLYAERLQARRERLARRRMEEFLLGVAYVRRAKKELAALREAYRKSQAYRYEAAARKIQPVWRGAVVRSRLARILKPVRRDGSSLDDDDDEEFHKVSVDFGEEGDGLLRPATLADLVSQAIAQERKGIGGPDVSNSAALFPRFDVPATIVNPTTAGNLPVSESAVISRETVGSSQQPRAGSAVPLGRVKQTVPLSGASGGCSRPSSEPLVPQKPTGPRPQRLAIDGGGDTDLDPGTTAGAPDAAWGASVAARIQKKNKKLEKVHQEYVRHEYLRDPLKAKKMAGAGGATSANSSRK